MAAIIQNDAFEEKVERGIRGFKGGSYYLHQRVAHKLESAISSKDTAAVNQLYTQITGTVGVDREVQQ
ncbi:MAG: hypothetical protein ACK518_02505 [bacterium]